MTPNEKNAYLSLHGLTVQNSYTDGTKSPPYRYEGVLRKWLDAVVLILTAIVDGERCICLRTCIRPPLLMRRDLLLPQPDEADHFALLELPAGLIEAGDIGEAGLFARASAEALEETGYTISPGAFERLGAAPFNTPGVMGERCFYVKACIEDVRNRISPKGDGSPVEEGGGIIWIPLKEALGMCDRGDILDMKTELGLRRIADKWKETVE
jgi:ADP-ribose pyrophosphatase